MEYIKLINGADMPMIGFGTFGLYGNEGENVIDSAIETGYRLFDTAQMYRNENIVGSAIKRSGIRCEEFFVTSKIFVTSGDQIITYSDIEKSLTDLGFDYVDLMLIHGPYPQSRSIYAVISKAVRRGLVKAFGLSNFNTVQYREFTESCNDIPVVLQSEIHPYCMRDKLRTAMRVYDTHIQAWAPLSSGRSRILNDPIIIEMAAKYGITEAQLILKYLLQLGISVIPKTADINHMKQNIALFDFEIEEHHIKKLSMLNKDRSCFNLPDE